MSLAPLASTLAKLAIPAVAAASLYIFRRRVVRRRAALAAVQSPAKGEAAETCACCSGATFSPTRREPTPRRALLGDLSRVGVGLSKDPTAKTKRECYIDWHDYFMSVALLSAFRSKDPNRQVGACIVDPKTLRIVGIGYNGMPIGIDDNDLPWARSADSWLDTKYPYVCHAEVCARPPVARAGARAHDGRRGAAAGCDRIPSLSPRGPPMSRLCSSPASRAGERNPQQEL